MKELEYDRNGPTPEVNKLFYDFAYGNTTPVPAHARVEPLRAKAEDLERRLRAALHELEISQADKDCRRNSLAQELRGVLRTWGQPVPEVTSDLIPAFGRVCEKLNASQSYGPPALQLLRHLTLLTKQPEPNIPRWQVDWDETMQRANELLNQFDKEEPHVKAGFADPSIREG